jgi:thiol-disulfide isomerase/thioredoxin
LVGAEGSMNKQKNKTMLQNKQELEKILQTNTKVFILFYASWCPHSLRFLPIFENCTKETKHSCCRFVIDEDEAICDTYSIDVYPTVIFFENGFVKKRLNGIPGVGLNEKQLLELFNSCN